MSKKLTLQCQLAYLKDLFTLVNDSFNCSSSVALWIACQSALETDFGRSRLYAVNNNCFGMKYPRKRLTLSVSELSNHASYRSLPDSVIDYGYWLANNGFTINNLYSLDSFRDRLCLFNFNPKCSLYLDSVNSIYNQFKDIFFESL